MLYAIITTVVVLGIPTLIMSLYFLYWYRIGARDSERCTVHFFNHFKELYGEDVAWQLVKEVHARYNSLEQNELKDLQKGFTRLARQVEWQWKSGHLKLQEMK